MVCKISPLVVGARGLVLEWALHHTQEYIDVPKKLWRPIIKDTVLASISDLVFMHRIRFLSPALVQLSEALNPSLQINRIVDFLRCSLPCRAKRNNGSMHEGLDTAMARWRRMVATPREQRGAGGNADTTT